MKAVKCPVCKFDCAPGDYGELLIAPVPWHFATGMEFTAMPAEGAKDRRYYDPETGKLDDSECSKPCPGSEKLGKVVQYD